MKKIMIAMGAVMSLALGAFAVDVTSGELKNAVMFDGITAGTQITSGLGDSEYPGAVENTAYYGDGGVHWECAGSTEDSIITNLTGDAVNNFLQIDQTDTLYRWMNQTTETSTNEVSSTKGIYFASKVQFTASDETNGVNLVSDASDKLLIWLRAADTNEDDVVDGTNLVITASADYPGGTKTDFVIDNSVYNVVPGEWYQLLVKSEYFNNGAGSVGVAFTVKIGAPGALESAMTTLEVNGTSTFYSMDANSTADDLSIAKVGFKGTGAADDLEFGTFDIAADTPFSVGGTPFATFDAAVAAAGDGGTVVLTKNYEATTSLDVGEGASIILDLAGHELSRGNVVINVGASATLIITNSTPTVGSVKCTGASTAAISNMGFLNIYGGKFFGDGTDYANDYFTVLVDDAAIDNVYETGKTTAYYVNTATGTSTVSVLEQVPSGDDAGYWVIKEAGSSTTEVTAYLSLNPASATYDETKDPQTPTNYTTVTVVFSNATAQVDALVLGTDYTITWSADTVTNATSDYVCTVTAAGTAYTFETVTATLEMLKYIPTWEVTFSTNNIPVAEYTTNVVDQQSLTADQIPAFTGGVWDVDPTNAVITCATNFNYTISGSNWPEAWNNNNEPASMKTAFDNWIAVPNDPTAENAEAAFLSGVNVADYTNDFAVATIAIVDGKVQLTGNYDLSKVNGAILLLTGDTPSTITTTNAVDKSATIEITPAEGETKKFYKLVLGYPAN